MALKTEDRKVTDDSTLTDFQRMKAENERLVAALAAASAPKTARSMADALNCKMTVQGSILTAVIDLGQSHGLSSTGKTTKVASTNGNIRVEVPGIGTVYVGLNAYRK